LPVKSIDKSAFGVPTGHGGSVCNRIIGTPRTVGANDRAKVCRIVADQNRLR
jgi:hypothetical protein